MKKAFQIRKLLFFLLFQQLISYSCSKDSCPLNAGIGGMQVRTIPYFNEIVLYDKINLILTEDSVQEVTVEAGAHLLDGIGTSVSNNILTIKNNNSCNFLRDPAEGANVYISTNQLQDIEFFGAGKVTATNTMKANIFTVDSWTGTGTITLDLAAGQVSAIIRNNNATITITGQSDSAYIYCADVGSVNLEGLAANTVNLTTKSLRNVYISVSNSLAANILYKGNVYYKGQPATIDTVIVNSGRLIHLP